MSSEVNKLIDEHGEESKIIHTRYRYNTNEKDESGKPKYHTIYLENNATDVTIDGFTPYTEEELANVPEIDPTDDRLMEALKKVDGKIKRIRISNDPDDPYSLFRLGPTMIISDNNVIDRKMTMLDNLEAYEAITEKEPGRLYVWEDDGVFHRTIIDVHNEDSTAHKDIRDALLALAGGVASVERAMQAGKLDPGAKINGVLFDGSKDITIEVNTEGLTSADSEKLGGVDANEYALKSDVYFKTQLYTKTELYRKDEIDARIGEIPGGKIYIE